jgi:hypothetical protein
MYDMHKALKYDFPFKIEIQAAGSYNENAKEKLGDEPSTTKIM